MNLPLKQPHFPLHELKLALLVVDDKGKIIDSNSACTHLLGFQPSELQNKNVLWLSPKVSVKTGDKISGSPSRVFSPDLLQEEGTYEDVSVQTKAGRPLTVEIHISNLKGNSERVVILRDTSLRKELQTQLIEKTRELHDTLNKVEKQNAELKASQEMLIQASKMAALGELTAGIAHEINQPLMGILGYAQELEHQLSENIQLPKDNPFSLFAREIISNARRMSEIIKHLRAFTRNSTEGYQPVQVNECIQNALHMVEKQFFAYGIQIECKLDPACEKVYANAIQIEQVLINLATNARDAIIAGRKGRGLIKIQTSNEDEHVQIKFSDDGVGMSSKTQEKIFNPFFTTKDVGSGMGLGLSISYGILHRLHGSIVVQSELGKGTEFVLQIPKDFREISHTQIKQDTQQNLKKNREGKK